MLGKPSKYDEAARLLIHSVKQDEIHLDPMPKFDDDFVRMNTVHTRQDLIGMLSYLSSLNKQIQSVRYLLAGILLALLILIFK